MKLLLLLLLLSPSMLTAQSLSPTASQNPMTIAVQGSNHLFHFTNKEASFFVGETNAFSTHWGVGYTSRREKIFSDYQLYLDAVPLRRDLPATRVLYQPHLLKRIYASPSAADEAAMPDSLDGLLITATASGAKQFSIAFFGDQFQKIVKVDTALNVAADVYVITLALKGSRFVSFTTQEQLTAVSLTDDRLQLTAAQGPAARLETQLRITLGVGATAQESEATARTLLKNYDALLAAKAERLQRLMDATGFETSDATLTRAFRWALCSFDALNMNENGKGIYAGLPWFNDYWGRDSFIALRALTVTGQFALAKENLTSFLRFQLLADTSKDYGKIPNRVRPDESIYNTADATPRFLIEAAIYAAYSNDKKFAAEIFPNLDAALRGTLKYRTDAKGYLIHNDADTWMDAVGPKGPYSPRGNRANDIQALWIEALQSTVQLCAQVESTESQSLQRLTSAALTKVQAHFEKDFVNDKATGIAPVVIDALRKDDSRSGELRPNALFTAGVLKNPSARLAMVKQLFTELTTPFGVLSLHHADKNFHPFHQYAPRYEQDASYHNGIIWLWNSGAIVSEMCRLYLQDEVLPVTYNSAELILRGAALGTLPELMDAMPRVRGVSTAFPDSTAFKNISRLDQMSLRNEARVPAVVGLPAVSGAFSQAWSLSEFIRNFYDDYFGVKVSIDGKVELRPALPSYLREAKFISHFGGIKLDATIEQPDSLTTIYNLGFTVSNPQFLPTREISFQDKHLKQPVLLVVQRGENPRYCGFVIRSSRTKLSITRNNLSYKASKRPSTSPNLYNTPDAKAFEFLDVRKIDAGKIDFTSQMK